MERKKVQSHKGDFDPYKVTKYFKNQNPYNGDGKFVDDVFPPNDNSILAQDNEGNFIDKQCGPEKSKGMDVSELEWKRIGDIYSKSLIFEDNIEFDDIKQGNLGNCYFLSAISALTEMPYLIYQIFRTKEKNDQGYFEVVLYIDGEWQVVIIDDFFVTIKGSSDLKFANTNGRELWAIILEKAWAKVNGGYVNTISGNPSDALMTITGFSVERIFHEKVDKEKLWEKVLKADKSDNIMCTSTSENEGTKKVGLVENHAYTLIQARQMEFDGEQLRLLKIRNPWGNKEWNGRYSDKSDLWTPEKRDFFGAAEERDDGTFFIIYEDYLDFYTDTNICYIMYDCNVKNFTVAGNDLGKAHIFSLYIPQTTQFTVSAIWRHWRFNRFARDDSHPTSIMIGSYNHDRQVSNVSGEFAAAFNVEVVRTLEKGYYTLWVYNNYEDTIEPKPDHFIVKFMGNSEFKVRKTGTDNGFHFLRHLWKTLLYDRHMMAIAESEGEMFSKIDNQHDSSGIGYLYVKATDPGICQKWTCDAKEMVMMSLFPPFNNKDEFDFGVAKNCGEYMILGMKKQQYGTYWFNIKSSYASYPHEAQQGLIKNENLPFVTDIDFKNFLPKSIRKDKVSKSYYDYQSASNEESKVDFDFEKIDVSEVQLNELKNEFPEKMKEVLEINSRDDFDETGLSWSNCNYGEGNGSYIGQFKGNSRHGRGYYLWDDDSSYYVGFWNQGKKDVYGKFVNGKGKITYSGDMADGEKNGEGTCYFSNGDRYKGEYKQGKRDGAGTYYWQSGNSWEGGMIDGQLHGEGTYTDTEGNNSPLTFDYGQMIQ